jgi:hypothetical protein
MSVGSTELIRERRRRLGRRREREPSVGSTELITGVGSTEPAGSGGTGFAGAGAETERRRRLGRRRERG